MPFRVISFLLNDEKQTAGIRGDAFLPLFLQSRGHLNEQMFGCYRNEVQFRRFIRNQTRAYPIANTNHRHMRFVSPETSLRISPSTTLKGDSVRITPASSFDHAELVRLLMAERVKMLAFIQSLVLDEDLAEDLYQDVCMLAVQKLATIQSQTHLLRWLRTTARFMALNALQKKRQRHLQLDTDILNLLESAWQKHDKYHSADLTESLRHCIDLLSPNAKRLIERRFMEEIQYEQLAVETGRPIGSLYVTFSRILSTLNDCISARLRRLAGGLDE